ncbi:DUF6266 family protein [Ancylomarina euxinus]|nr:DUF6266 family protein [Ancylomarina euxinus]MCZ4696479.1 DUF6266 family protein [Ancylomarina euxinus]MUP16851.1 hypothetical protein [Ancylomarina euxinus]
MGNIIFYVRNGKQCMRAMPQKVKNPKSTKQSSRRSQFGATAKFASSLLSVLIHPYWNPIAKKEDRSGYNLFLTTNMPAFTAGLLQKEKLLLIPENELKQEQFIISQTDMGIQLTWSYTQNNKKADPNDELTLLIMSPNGALEIRQTQAKRSEQELMIEAPKEQEYFAFWERGTLWSETCWLPLQSDN